jgi:glycosyltransferase involved in cell wall biosynthesis
LTSVCIASAAWRRLDVTRLVLRQRQRLCVELAARGIHAVPLIAADDENLDIAAEYGCETLEIPNAPLGNKCNLMLRHAADLFDWIVWIGSDDWIHPDVFDPLDGRDRPVSIIRGFRLCTVNLETGQLSRVASPSAYGGIPWLLDSRLIRGKSRDPIKPHLNRGLDGALIRGLRLMNKTLTFEDHDPHEFRCVDFKTRDNLSPYEGLVATKGYDEPGTSWDELERWFPTDLVNDACALSSALQGDAT